MPATLADALTGLAGLGPGLIVQLLLLGAMAGFLAGLLGIGGGMVMVPFLTWIVAARGVPADMAVKLAVATAMATIVFTSLSSLRAHQRHGSVRWHLVAAIAPGVITGGLLAGSVALSALHGRWLAFAFAAFAVASAVHLVRDRPPRPGRTPPGVAGQIVAGTGIGFASGLVGAGGAFLTIPFLVWCNLPMRIAVGTSAAIGFPIAVSSTAGYVIGGWHLTAALPGSFGYLFVPAIIALAIGSVTMAPLGARTANAVDVQRLKRVFAMLQLALAASMLYRVLAV